jgi:hypothetical protein
MVRRKNLLEAFQRSQPSAGENPAASGSSGEANLPLFEAPAGRRTRSALSFGLPLGLVAVVLAFSLGFVLGRAGRQEARAEVAPRAPSPPANQPRAFQEPLAAQSARPDETTSGASERIQDSPLFDPANQYTVIVASYTKGKGDANQELAWATYQHLKDEGLPVFRPVVSGNLFVVLAGAAPTRAELETVEKGVRALERDGDKPYFDAYRVSIDKLIPRSKGGE